MNYSKIFKQRELEVEKALKFSYEANDVDFFVKKLDEYPKFTHFDRYISDAIRDKRYTFIEPLVTYWKKRCNFHTPLIASACVFAYAEGKVIFGDMIASALHFSRENALWIEGIVQECIDQNVSEPLPRVLPHCTVEQKERYFLSALEKNKPVVVDCFFSQCEAAQQDDFNLVATGLRRMLSHDYEPALLLKFLTYSHINQFSEDVSRERVIEYFDNHQDWFNGLDVLTQRDLLHFAENQAVVEARIWRM